MELLWTDKYRPLVLMEIVSQNKVIQEIEDFIGNFKPGKGLFLHGPPGIGKTLIFQVMTREKSLDLLEMNASDERGEERIAIFSETAKTRSIFSKGKIILIDEVDGISGKEDRGAVSAIVDLIKKSRFPVFLVGNDPWLPKLRGLRNIAKLVKVNRVSKPSIEKRLKEITEKEGVLAGDSVLKNLARWSAGDIRSAITDLQLICHGKKEIGENDLEILGARDRDNPIFNILPLIFRSKNLSFAKKSRCTSEVHIDLQTAF